MIAPQDPCEAARPYLAMECLWQILTNFAWPLLATVITAFADL